MSITVPYSHSFATAGEQGVDSLSTQSELTVSQSAALLDMPEGCIYELLKIGAIQYRQEGTQRLINRDVLLEYKYDSERGKNILDEMVRVNQEMGLYDD